VRAELTRYAVPGWGVGELWTADGLVLAHEFFFGTLPDDESDATARPHELVERFRRFFAGDDVRFDDVQLEEGSWTPFQHGVASILRETPRGEVVTYGELAALAGYPGAARAAGTFCAQNRFMIIIPCHRVVSADGLGSYGSAGLGVKRRLLALEGVEL
jgi:O-6-methylguanine DNA methyltransferase